MFLACGLSANCPYCAVAYFKVDYVERPWWRTVQNISSCGIERAVMAWTLETLILTLVIDGTG